MAENIQLNIEENEMTEENEMSLDNFIVNNDDFVNRRNRRLGITTNIQRQVDNVWERDGTRLLNRVLNGDDGSGNGDDGSGNGDDGNGGGDNITTIPFEDGRREALKLWSQGISWPTVSDTEHQERHQDWMRDKCEMLFNTKSMPNRYAFAILMLLGPTNLRSPELNCWEDCYDFLDFDDEEGMFKMVTTELEAGQTVNCACSHHIKNLFEVTCKDVEYNKDGSIDNIDMRALHLGSDCIYKRSIVPKIKDEVNKHGTSNPSPMLKKMIYEVAKKEKKRCDMCNELNVGYTSKFDKCKDCRNKLKFIKKVKKKAIEIIGEWDKIWPLTENGSPIRNLGWKHVWQNGVRNPKTWRWIANNDIDHIYDTYNNENYDLEKFIKNQKWGKLNNYLDLMGLYYRHEDLKDAITKVRKLLYYKIFFEDKILKDAQAEEDEETIELIKSNMEETNILILHYRELLPKWL